MDIIADNFETQVNENEWYHWIENFHSNKRILPVTGIGWVLTDFVTDAYITDVIVSPHFLGKGLGKQLVNEALERLNEHSVEEVKLACSLYANPGKKLFYAKFGFQPLSRQIRE